MEDKSRLFYADMSLATGSGNETVAAHNSTVIDFGAGDTLAHKVVSGNALSGILTHYWSEADYYAQVTTTCTGATATLVMKLYTSTSATLASGNSLLDRNRTDAVVAVATLVAGCVLLQGNLRGKKLDRYFGAIHTIATAALTAGVLRGAVGYGIVNKRIGGLTFS
jgi:hypothetical protein